MDWAEELRSWAEGIGLSLPPAFTDEVHQYYEALVAANEQFNLTRITDHRAYIVKHVMDSLLGMAAMPTLATGRHRVLDLGSGAGIPAVFLARANLRLTVTAVDGTGKKMRWLETTVRAAGWDNLKAIHSRAEELSRNKPHTAGYDLVTARAVGDAVGVMRHAWRLLAPGGTMLLYKTPTQMEEEVETVGTVAETLKLDVRYSEIYELPDDAGLRSFWLVRRHG